MNKIGFSHGVLYKIMDNYTKEAFDVFAQNGSEIIEICVAKTKELEKLNKATPFVLDYPYKSIHLPTDVRYKNDKMTKDVLDHLLNFYNDIEADLALVHPDLVEDWNVFNNYSLNWAIENMDNRKERYRNLGDLKSFFEQYPRWRLVLDLNHCYSNDNSMSLADDFIASFSDRISEIHLSGYLDYHEPLYKTKQDIILNYCRKFNDTPIIIESVFDSVDEVEKEMVYIKNIIK